MADSGHGAASGPGTDARRFENWEFAYALVLGLGAAARYAADVGIDRGGRRARELAAYAREVLGATDGVRLLDLAADGGPIVSAAIRTSNVEAMVIKLRKLGINVSAVFRNHAVIDMDAKHVASAIRISPHYYNRREEIDQSVEMMAESFR